MLGSKSLGLLLTILLYEGSAMICPFGKHKSESKITQMKKLETGEVAKLNEHLPLFISEVQKKNGAIVTENSLCTCYTSIFGALLAGMLYTIISCIITVVKFQ